MTGLDAAIAAAIGFFRDTQEPHALLWLEWMRRRFAIEIFAGALERFDRLVADRASDRSLLRVLRRIADRASPLSLEDLEAVTHSSDRIIVCGLHCDRIGVPPSFPDVLAKARDAGGYYLTHALLATVWMDENRCRAALSSGLVESLELGCAEIVNHDPAVVSDLKLEAAAFLCLAGQTARVSSAFVASVIATQNDDGGWGEAPDDRPGSDWHATVVALLLLLHLQERASRQPGNR